jgi:hypothetical protein
MKMDSSKTFVLAAVLLAVTVCAGNIPAQAQTFTTIYTFTGKDAEGEHPSGGLAFDSDGAMPTVLESVACHVEPVEKVSGNHGWQPVSPIARHALTVWET